MKAIFERLQWWLPAFVLLLLGATMAGGGVWLLILGGSTYYLLGGLVCFVVGILLFRRDHRGLLLYLGFLGGTTLWALGEVGTDFWRLMPRLAAPLAIGAAIIIVLPGDRRVRSAVLASAVLAFAALLFLPRETAPELSGTAYPGPDVSSAEWRAFGNAATGTRYSAADQISPANVAALKPAWTYHTGDTAKNFPGTTAALTFEATPIAVGGRVVLCTPHGIVVALDPDTGRQLWRFDPRIDETDAPVLACRGVSYYVADPGTAICPQRILYGTIDGRLIALDAATGRPCSDFGRAGTVNLKAGLGKVEPGSFGVSSPPTIVGRAVILGGFVMDNLSVDEPSGVIRAYDAMDGRQLWAWDSAGPSSAGREGYVRSSPNGWSVFAADLKLGLVYVPLGNATPDFFGGHRTAAQDRHSSSVIALEAATGRLRWSFQTVHHDLWDYDLGAQPVLADVRRGGQTIPALLQATKHGEIFMLDRRDGRPLAPVEERTAPRGDVPGERYAPTQPYSTGMPSFTPPPLVEEDMWGATPLDQLWCRIRFRSLDYRGKFTPPSLRGSLQYPGNFGVVDWGSVSVDEMRDLMVVNASYLPLVVQLIDRRTMDPVQAARTKLDAHAGFSPQRGTPFGVKVAAFLSPLGLPCIAPPWGTLSAVDLARRTRIWRQPLGTTSDHAPFGIAVPGVFNLGGTMVTRSGLTFVAATIDDYLRAFDTRSGRLLWRARLPAGGQAAPITYVSSRSGRQFVVIAAGGHKFMATTPGDSVVAYALPRPR